MSTERAIVETALGPFVATVESGVVTAAVFASEPQHAARDAHGVHDRLVAYFAGEVDALDALAADAPGTPFQREVWKHLRAIPAGETLTYGELAERVGVPRGARAVGQANHVNPITLIVPCHRVVRSGGALGGYAYGLAHKRFLLAHERDYSMGTRGTIFGPTRSKISSRL